MSWTYPLLDQIGLVKEELGRDCFAPSLFSNHFRHFADARHESEMWTAVRVLGREESQGLSERFREYEKVPLTGEPVGVTKAKSSVL
jgi:hypothetical protein